MHNRDQAGLELLPDQLFGDRYRIIMQIGKGGMGRVYLAEDMKLGGKTRALKLTKPLPDESRSFLPEAQLLSELDHPHLPAIVDYYPPNSDGVACIVMDYIAGDTLAERFERYSLQLSFSFVLGVLVDLCEVLIYLHAQTPSIVFRDLKPANVLLDRHNRAILVDFGIARRFQESRNSDTLQLGTPGFAAPEQLRGEQSDCRTDLYGLGALAYHLLSRGRFAIRHRGQLKRALQADVPADFAMLLGRLLANQPDDRPQSAYELYSELIKIGFVTDEDDKHPSHNSVSIGHRSYHPYDSDNTNKVIVIAMASAYPGAGGTFASLALSSSLARQGIAHALVECPGSEPELYAQLNGARYMPKGAVFAQSNGQQAAAPAWRNGKAVYYPADPRETCNTRPDGAFASWLRKLGVPLVVLDVSSHWEHSDLAEWVCTSTDHIAIVVDCYPVKWSRRRQTLGMELMKGAQQRQIPLSWIANRDQSFSARKEWLSLFPAKPEVYLPDLTSPELLNGIWRGEGLPMDSQFVLRIDQAYTKWTASLID